MFYLSQAFPTEKSTKKPDFSWLFLNSKKAIGIEKKPEFQNLASKETNWQS